MDTIESEISKQDYDGLGTRELRRKFAKDQYEDAKEAAEIRSLGQATALRKTQEEEQERKQRLLEQKSCKTKNQKELFIESELTDIEKTIPRNELQAAVLDLVQVVLSITQHTSIMIKFLFPENYPSVVLATFVSFHSVFTNQETILIDLRSTYLDSELLQKLKVAGENEAKKLIGEKQVVHVINRIRTILEKNRLAPAFAELKQLTGYFEGKNCLLKSANEKTGLVAISLKSGNYFLNLDLLVPFEYPAKPAEIVKESSNLPKHSLSSCLQNAQEKARHLAEFPELVEDLKTSRSGAGSGNESKSELLSQSQTLASRNRVNHLAAEAEESKQRALEKRKKKLSEFVSRPSLLPLIQMLYEDCLLPFASQKCKLCQKNLIPSDPNLLSKVPRSMEILRLYCGHLYHFKCLENYLSSPPFGKKCLHCNAKIQHSKLMTDEKILEQRWTHQQARKREIEDVTEFMNL